MVAFFGAHPEMVVFLVASPLPPKSLGAVKKGLLQLLRDDNFWFALGGLGNPDEP